MSVIKNIKNVFGDIIKEHPFSIISFFIAMVLRALFLTSYYEDTPNLEYFNLISIIIYHSDSSYFHMIGTPLILFFLPIHNPTNAQKEGQTRYSLVSMRGTKP